MNIHKSYYETLYSRPVVALSGYCAKYDLPDSLYEDYQTLFGLLLSEYLDETGKERMENEMEDLYFIMNQIAGSRDGDGKPVEIESPWGKP